MALWDQLTATYVYSAVILAILSYVVVVKLGQRKRGNYPPGPRGWPLLGYTKFVSTNPVTVVKELSGKSPVIMFPVGDENIVILDTLEAIKDGYVKQGNLLTGVPKTFKKAGLVMDFIGIAFEEGESWRHQRKTIINLMKDFGVGKTALEDKVIHECDFLVKEVNKKEGKPFYPMTMLAKVSSNVISAFVFGTRFDYDDPFFGELLEITVELDMSFGVVTYVDYFKYLHYLPKWMTGLDKISKLRKRTAAYAEKRVKEHVQQYDENSLKDYVDHCLHEIYEKKAKGEVTNMDTEMRRLRSNAMAFFSAGSNSSALMLTWYMHYLMIQPEVSKKVVAEIDSVIGHDRNPSWMDRRNMPFLEAFFYEVERMVNLVPIGIPHWTTDDMKILGYDIPARSLIHANFGRALSDPVVWGDPDNFRPERFIDEKTGQTINSEHLFTFGIGKRICPGMNLAKMEVFLILTTLLQNFSLQAAEGQTPVVSDGIVRLLKPYDIIMKPRKLHG